MTKKLLPLLALAALSAAVHAATPPGTLVVAQGLDDIVSLDPAEANELSSIQTVPSLYQRLVQPDRDTPEKISPILAEMQSEFDMTLRMKYDSLEILNTNFPDETGIEERLEQALQKLPERCRSIFVMNKLEGKKQQQIASELQISINTVESQMAIAYKKLREELKDCLPLLLFLFTLP